MTGYELETRRVILTPDWLSFVITESGFMCILGDGLFWKHTHKCLGLLLEHETHIMWPPSHCRELKVETYDTSVCLIHRIHVLHTHSHVYRDIPQNKQKARKQGQSLRDRIV